MLIKGEVVIIERDNMCATITNKGIVLEIEHNCNDEELYNFEMVAISENDQAPFDVDPCSNLN